MNKVSGSKLFMVEFIIVLLFFSISAGVCVSIFVKAENISKLSADKNTAIFYAQSAAEWFKATDGDGLEKGENNFYFNEEFQLSDDEIDGGFHMSFDIAQEEGILSAEILIDKNGKELCNLPVKKYIPEAETNGKK